MEITKLRVNGLNRLMKWPLLCGLLSFVLVQAVPATLPLYDNESVLSYNIPPDIFPTIDASNFLNNSSLTINFANATVNTVLFETLNTVNYTNSKTGTLSANNGFQFDTQTTNVIPHQMAGSFYNKGIIDCSSALTNAQMIVWATNIVNPGIIDVGENGLVQFTGNKVDLTRAQLTIEGTPAATGLIAESGFYTNWVPSADLTPNSATASPPVGLGLFNSTSYFDIRTNATPGGTNATIIIRAVFVETNQGPNVADNVYIDVNTGGLGLGGGAAHVEWVGTYVDPVSDLVTTNYLYLTDDYLAGAITNVPVQATGISSNFTVISSLAPVIFGPPTPAGFPPGFAFNPPGVVTNTYSYSEIQFPATTVPTNSPSQNVSNYLAILAGRVQITANQELTMPLSEITGPNYLSITATNQFDGSAGSQIYSAFSDLNLGVTNGFMTVSNLLEPFTVRWEGTIQAWSATWLYVDPVTGNTNDNRVLLVSSQLSPVTPSQVQHLILHSTNSIVIGDTLNIIGTFSEDAQNLTVTTNANNPVTLDGELDLQPSGLSWASSNPNLRNLTNNGTIQSQNLAVFGTAPPANYFSLINSGQISTKGAQVWANNFVNSGMFSSGAQSFTLQSLTTTLTNGSVSAGGNISITTGSMVASNVLLSAGDALTIAATNSLTDTGVTNGSIWTMNDGINLIYNPTNGDLLGTTITNTAPDNQDAASTWAGIDLGYSTAGYSNNAAVGRFILDAVVTNPAHTPPFTQLTFNGVGASNAMYVDYLELRDYATNRQGNKVLALNFDPANPSLVIYYAQAVANGATIAEKINHGNGDHLRWLPAYVGFYSSTNIVYTNIVNSVTNFSTNTFNTALAQSTTYDSNGNGIVNANDPTPFYVASEMNFKLTITNLPPPTVLISWQTIPGATNYLSYRTNLVAGNSLPLTNFVTSAPYGSGLTTVTVADPVSLTGAKYYQVRVVPSTAPPYGPGP